VDYAHQRELKIIKHTDGNAWPILDDFVEVGFLVHPIQFIQTVKRKIIWL